MKHSNGTATSQAYRLILVTVITFLIPLSSLLAEDPIRLFHQGKSSQARSAFERQLKAARELSDNPLIFWRNKETVIWQALFSYAWFEAQTGHFEKAIELSNEALTVASQQEDPYKIGRTLTWLGHGYAYQGAYTLALEFFDEALEIGEHNGRIVYPMIWGLATQEKGAILFRMGDLASAKSLLKKTLSYARQYHIYVGIAESAAHMADISLHEGALGDALQYATEAEKAALRCACSPQILARSKLVQAEILYQKYLNKISHDKEVFAAIKDAQQYAESAGLDHLIALGKLLESKLIRNPQIMKKEELLNDALSLLEALNHEERGRANIETGRLYLEQNATKLAQYYLERGFSINEESFRLVDNAYATPTFEELTRQLGGNEQERLQELKVAVDRALEVNALPLLFKLYQDLSFFYEDIGYYQLSYETGEKALQTGSKLLEHEKDEHVINTIQETLIEVKSHLVQLSKHAIVLPSKPE